MAYETVGYDWHQWNNVGPCDAVEPADEVRVVVYRGILLREAQRRYPVVSPGDDYRYLAYEDALSYLDARVREASDLGMPELAAELQATRNLILNDLES